MDVVSIISDYFNIFYILILLCSHVLGDDRPETSYTRVMGHMDVVSIISDHFNILYIVILLCSHVLGEDRPETYTWVMGHMGGGCPLRLVLFQHLLYRDLIVQSHVR
jgi:hypothetical protein